MHAARPCVFFFGRQLNLVPSDCSAWGGLVYCIKESRSLITHQESIVRFEMSRMLSCHLLSSVGDVWGAWGIQIHRQYVGIHAKKVFFLILCFTIVCIMVSRPLGKQQPFIWMSLTVVKSDK